MYNVFSLVSERTRLVNHWDGLSIFLYPIRDHRLKKAWGTVENELFVFAGITRLNILSKIGVFFY